MAGVKLRIPPCHYRTRNCSSVPTRTAKSAGIAGRVTSKEPEKTSECHLQLRKQRQSELQSTTVAARPSDPLREAGHSSVPPISPELFLTAISNCKKRHSRLLLASRQPGSSRGECQVQLHIPAPMGASKHNFWQTFDPRSGLSTGSNERSSSGEGVRHTSTTDRSVCHDYAPHV